MAVAGVVALLLFGPEQLPKVARKAGQLVRDVQNTSQSFIRELERAADEHETSPSAVSAAAPLPPIADTLPPPVQQPIPAPPPVLAEAGSVETVAPVRNVAPPVETTGPAMHNAIVDERDARADAKAAPAADSHAG